MQNTNRLLSVAALCLAFSGRIALGAEPVPVDFAHEVLPILKAKCAECHTNVTYKGAFSMDTRKQILESESIVAGDAEESDLIARVVTDDEFTRMPPEGDRLTEAEVATLRKWIDADVPWTDGFSFRESEEQVPLALQPVDVPDETAASGPHPLDRLLASYAREHEIELAPLADDSTFVRRAYLDLIGLLPTEQEQADFLANESENKRAELVEALLARQHDYASHWMTFWNDLLRNDYAGTGYIDGGRSQITGWLHAALLNNMPYNTFVEQLIAPSEESAGFAKGIIWRGRVNASQVPPLQFSQNVGQVFLGVNLKCASCHDSFIDDWRLVDAYGLAAVVSQEPLELHRCDIPQGTFAEPGFIFPELGSIDPNAPPAERQQQLAKLMIDKQNGRLPRTLVNRLWQRLMGYGLVEPVDAMAGPAWDPEVLEYLANYLVDHDYDVKALLGHITSSRAYARQSVGFASPPVASDYVFRGPMTKRMTAEQFIDAVWTITKSGPEKPDAQLDVGQLSDDVGGPKVRAAFMNADALMRALGRPNREQVVTTRPDELTTLQALDLSNGPEFSKIVENGAKTLSTDSTSEQPGDFVQQLFQSALARDATPEEIVAAKELLGSEMTPQGVADLLWAMVILPEFQHIR